MCVCARTHTHTQDQLAQPPNCSPNDFFQTSHTHNQGQLAQPPNCFANQLAQWFAPDSKRVTFLSGNHSSSLASQLIFLQSSLRAAAKVLSLHSRRYPTAVKPLCDVTYGEGPALLWLLPASPFHLQGAVLSTLNSPQSGVPSGCALCMEDTLVWRYWFSSLQFSAKASHTWRRGRGREPPRPGEVSQLCCCIAAVCFPFS